MMDPAGRTRGAAKAREPSLPNTLRVTALQPPHGFQGVEITGPAGALGSEPLIVSGLFVIPEVEGARIDERLHRALVLVKMSKDLYHVTNPFQDVVLFEDDEERSGGARRGCFSFNAFDGFAEIPPGEYHVLVSLGGYLSNTLTVLVG